MREVSSTAEQIEDHDVANSVRGHIPISNHRKNGEPKSALIQQSLERFASSIRRGLMPTRSMQCFTSMPSTDGMSSGGPLPPDRLTRRIFFAIVPPLLESSNCTRLMQPNASELCVALEIAVRGEDWCIVA